MTGGRKRPLVVEREMQLGMLEPILGDGPPDQVDYEFVDRFFSSICQYIKSWVRKLPESMFDMMLDYLKIHMQDMVLRVLQQYDGRARDVQLWKLQHNVITMVLSQLEEEGPARPVNNADGPPRVHHYFNSFCDL